MVIPKEAIKKRVKRGRVYSRKASCGRYYQIRQLKKKDIRFSKKDENTYIDACNILTKDMVDFTNWKKKNFGQYDRLQVLNFIYEEVMKKIMVDMIENKNTYIFHDKTELIIATIDNYKKRFSFFTYDTKNTNNYAVHKAEHYGIAWKIYTSKEIDKILKHYTNVRKENYILCKSLIGKQSLASYRGKLSLLMSKLRKKGLSLSSIQQP
jgi:hypothetical protein